MLWTDQDFVSVADLATMDNDIVATATAQQIDLTLSIRRGLEEAGRYLEANMISFSTYVSSQDLSSNHFNAVHYTGTQPNARRRFSLEQIVISGRNINYWSELKLWAVNRVLMVFYFTASNKAEDDRYEAKYEMYKKRDIEEMWPLFKKTGLPVVTRPMPRPMAAQARNAGSFSVTRTAMDFVSTQANLDVGISFVDQSLYINEASSKNGQSDVSDRVTLRVYGNEPDVVQVDITNLNPPDGTLPPDQMARGFIIPLTATGWNIWAGTVGGVLQLVNALPIPIATKTRVLNVTAGLTLITTDYAGPNPGTGQYAEAYYTIPDLFFRG